MLKQIVLKLIQLLLTLFIATLAVFILIQQAPSDPVRMMLTRPDGSTLAADKQMLEEEINITKEKLGLNDSIWVQYQNWVTNIAHGRLGTSILTRQDISKQIITYLPNSIIIALSSTLLQFLLALLFGVLSVVYVSKWQEHVLRIIAIFFRSVPFFAISIFLLKLFSVQFKLYPISNSADLKRLWLPTVAVGITIFPKLSRIIRNSLLDELGKQYMVSYLAKGFPPIKLLKEAFRNAFIPIFTTLSISFASSIGGMVIAESIFTWPGLGNYGMQAVLGQDYPVVQGYILVVTLIVVLVNYISDLFYPLINPVLRRGQSV